MMMEEASKFCPSGGGTVDQDTFFSIMDNSTWY
jgi:hypothetical protein